MSARAERMFATALGQRLRFLRLVRGLTTRQLAERSGVAPATVNAIELGVRPPSVVVLLRLAAALRVPWVALAERGQEDAARLLREEWEANGPAGFPPALVASRSPSALGHPDTSSSTGDPE